MNLKVPSVHWARRPGSAGNALASLLLAALLLVPTGPYAAIAAERPKPPILVAVEGEQATVGGEDQTSLRIRWEIDGREPLVEGLVFSVSEASGAPVGNYFEQVRTGDVLEVAGVHTIRSAKIKPGVRYCVTIKARIGPAESAASYSDETEQQCVTMPGRPNLAISEIRGKEDIEWAATNQRNPVYIFMLRNDGADALDRVVVEIKTSGVVTIADEQLPILVQGWESNGFTCERIGVSGGANAGLLCSGGTLTAGQEINPAILTRVTRRGFGAVHVAINVNRGRGDANPDDNRLTLNVQVS